MAGGYHPSLMGPVLIAAVQSCGFCPGGDYPAPPDWLPVVVAATGLTVATLLFLAAIALRLNEREVPRVLPTALAAAFGAGASLEVLAWAGADPAQLALLVAVVAVPALVAASMRKYGIGGWYLAAAGLLPLLWWGYFVAQDLFVEGVSYDDELIAWVAGALAAFLLGIAGIAAGDRPMPASRDVVPPDQPDPRRAVAIATAVAEELRFGPADLPNSISLLAGIVAGILTWMLFASIGLHPLLIALASAVVMALVSTELFYHLWPRSLARAMDAHAFVGSWEVKRFRETTGAAVPTSAAAARRWLETYPETDENRWVRPEMLAWAGEIDAAYEVLGRLPERTDTERFDRQSLKVFLDTVSGAPADVDGLVAAAEHVGEPNSDERLRAVAAAAMARSRDILARGGGGWKQPMIEAQDRIGRRSSGIVRSDTWLRRFRAYGVISAAFALLSALPLLFPT